MIWSLVLLHISVSLAQQVAPSTEDPPPGCGVPHTNLTIHPRWNKLFSAGHNLTVFYKNPSCGYGPGHELIRTAIIYLEQLEELEKVVDTNRPNAMDVVWELYIGGGPLHLRQIPYDQFIKVFKWNSDNVDEYFTVIDDTRRVWNRLVEELERVADPNIII